MKKQFGSTILRYGASLFTVCLLASNPSLRAQEFGTSPAGVPPPGGAMFTFRTGGAGGGFGLVINGADVGTILLKACDQDGDARVTPAELKVGIAACFTLWDANTNGSLSGSELAAGLKQLFPSPPPGGMRGVRVLNGVAVEVPPDEPPTPDAQVARHILAGSDSNKDSALTLQEVSQFLLGKCFSQWDQDGNGSLDAPELNAALGQLARPDDP